MSLLHFPFILAAATSMHIAVTAPHITTPSERVKSSTFREMFITKTIILSHIFTVVGKLYSIFNAKFIYNVQFRLIRRSCDTMKRLTKFSFRHLAFG